jgi:hypothetical protein
MNLTRLALLSLAFSLGLFARTSPALAEYVGTNNVVSVSGCSSYLMASPKEHEASAIANWRVNASQACLNRGFTEWETQETSWSPGINVPHYCLNATVVCH